MSQLQSSHLKSRFPAPLVHTLAAGLLCALALSTAVTPALAKSYPEYVKSACKRDFKKYCPAYDVESSSLRSCMRSVADDLSRRCYEALERSGERRRR